jgi:hypothetical protein
VLVEAGYGDVQVNVLADSSIEIDPYDIVVGLSGATGPQVEVLKNAYRAGKSVLVMDADAVSFVASTYSTEAGNPVNQTSIEPFDQIVYQSTEPLPDPNLMWVNTEDDLLYRYFNYFGSSPRTNLAGNPSLDDLDSNNRPDSWGSRAADWTGITLVPSPFGSGNALRIQPTSTVVDVGAFCIPRFSVSAGDVVTVSMDALRESGKAPGWGLEYFNSDMAYIGGTYAPISAPAVGVQGRVQRTVTVPATFGALANNIPAHAHLLVYTGGQGLEEDIFLFDNLLIEKSATANSYFDGSSDLSTAWTGTPSASPSTYMPGWYALTDSSAISSLITPVPSLAHPVAQGWRAFPLTATGSTTVYTLTDEDSYTMVSATVPPSDPPARIFTTVDPGLGGRAVVVSALVNPAQFTVQGFREMLVSAVSWLNPVVLVDQWETQIGEFMIDRISEPHFPHEVRITGRDYAKKCMNSKFAYATQFEEGYLLEALISAIASNAGVGKKQLPNTGIVVGKSFYFDRGVTRWEAMKEIATAYNYDLYFNAQGYLVMSEFVDPASESPALYIETGTQGQIASYEKATTDTRIYNFVVVTGESSDSAALPVYAIATNTDPTSPTNVDEIGERVYQYVSSFITTTEQAQDVADKFLAIHSLEEFELSFDTLVLPWLDVGQIIGFVDPRPAPGDPTAFLLTGLTFPLSLGPMSGSARRVTIVG